MLRQRIFRLFRRFSRLGNGLLAVALLALAFAPLNVAHSASNNSHSIHSAQLTLADLPNEAQAAISTALQRAKLTASDGAASDQLGYSVSISGDGNTIVVGAPLGDGAIANQGATYVFTKPGGGWGSTSTYTAKLTNSDYYADAYDWFGSSVAISADGNTIVVGAWHSSRFLYTGHAHEGRAFVFVKPGGGWATTSVYDAVLTQSTYYGDDLFGWSVAIRGDGKTVVVGAPHMTSTYYQRGAAYVFYEPGGGWSGTVWQHDMLTASDGADYDYFGTSVSINAGGDAFVVGASGDDIGSHADQGSAYVFAYVTPPYWSQYKLTASDGSTNNEFGNSVAISGDGGAVVVGAHKAPFGLASNVGAAYVFVPPFSGWTDMNEAAKLGTVDWVGDNYFGESVSISADGNSVVVGASSSTGQGAGYLFVKPGGGWSGVLTQPSKLTASDGAANDRFGNSVSISANGIAIAIGAPSSDIVANADQGSAYVYAVKKTLTVKSAGAQDGWILESTETSNVGGSLNATAATFNLGDNAARKQYRGILSFNTGPSLLDNAVITSVMLKVKKQGIIGGGNPVTMFQGFMVDIKKGFFGTTALQVTDFQAAASKTYGPFMTSLGGGWYSINLTSGKAYINKLSTLSGLTQIRLRFKLDDNNNAVANYLSLYSGHAAPASRPQLIIEYYVP